MTQLLPAASEMAPVRVVIVDDSSVARGFLARWISECDDLQLVGTAANGLEAITMIPAAKPDVVILDIEMPQMNGLEALPLIRIAAPEAAIIMSSRLTRKNAELALLCLQNGATEIIPKPSADERATPLPTYQQELLDKLRTVGRRGKIEAQPLLTREPLSPFEIISRPLAAIPSPPRPKRAPAREVHAAVVERPAPQAPPLQSSPAHGSHAARAILVGASTGGPNACAEFITALKPLIARIPVIIAQHMPPVFTRVFGEHLAAASGVTCREARDGEALVRGHVYIAPGGHHIRISGAASAPTITLDHGPPVRFSRPSVDLLFHSAREVFGADVTAVVLTGMGSDGLEGARDLAAAGARIYVQDERSSVVWGMPGAIARAGLANEIATPSEIAAALVTQGGKS
ncbi:chemotaxis-specific protein-glutamate methyltransferase CheB [Terrarubrum flagellatum]|uniref:chemotaxis-specific protein-glutamate methyltransferase CheB n=1 Tax=Terrirubrum flagellatum TaxID=2895980 RepID=UPI003145022D